MWCMRTKLYDRRNVTAVNFKCSGVKSCHDYSRYVGKFVYDSDSTPVTEQIMDYLEWGFGQPDPTGGKTCVGYLRGQLYSIPCYGYSKDATPLGYICEARPMDSLDPTKTCNFPFEYLGKTYDSCSHDTDAVGKC
jgi:hypothetical protein